jgi:dihydropteroate synthase
MQDAPSYDDVMEEVHLFLGERRDAAVEAGVDPDRILLDPGIGFGKRLEDNLALLSRLRELRCLGHPLLVGASRKRFIGDVTGAKVGERLAGSLAAATAAAFSGADIVRVHDVRETVQAMKVVDAIVKS